MANINMLYDYSYKMYPGRFMHLTTIVFEIFLNRVESLTLTLIR